MLLFNLTLTPGIWTIILIISVFLSFYIGNIRSRYNPFYYLSKLIKEINKVFYRGKDLKLKGSYALLVEEILILILILILQRIFINNFIIFIIFSILFISSAISNNFLLNLNRSLKIELLNNNLLFTNRIIEVLLKEKDLKYNKNELIQLLIQINSTLYLNEVFSPLFFSSIGIITSIWFIYLNPVTLLALYMTLELSFSKINSYRKNSKEFYHNIINTFNYINYIPARIGSYILLLTGTLLGYDFSYAFKVFLRDRFNHINQNFGHPLSVIAGLLKIKLEKIDINQYCLLSDPIGDNIYQIILDDVSNTITLFKLSEIVYLFIGTFIISISYLILNLI